MKNKILSFAVLIFATATSFAQNSAIYKAEELMNDEELIKAQSVITPALTNPKTKLLGYAYNVAGNIECRLLQPEILKAADHQALDTTLFVNSLNAAAKYFIESDKIYKAMPKHNAEAKEKMADNKNMMRQILSYFAYAGQFENQRGNKKGAYESFEKFIALPQCPIFTEEETKAIYDKDRELYNRIGYYATLLANEMKDYDGILKNVDFAIANPESRNDGYILKLQAYLEKQDTASWVKTARQAIEDGTDNATFCNNLLYYYNSHNLKDEAKAMADELVQKAPNSKMAWYARGCVSMNTFKKFDDARADFDKAIELDPNFIDAIYNKGVSYVNELISLNLNTDTKSKDYKQTLEKAHQYYGQAQPLFEKVRQLAPEKPELWAENLRMVYFNLDKQDLAKEMEQVVLNMHK